MSGDCNTETRVGELFMVDRKEKNRQGKKEKKTGKNSGFWGIVDRKEKEKNETEAQRRRRRRRKRRWRDEEARRRQEKS